MPLDIRKQINKFTEMNDPNFPRRLNRYLRPVIQNARIASPNSAASTIFITRIPYAVDSFRQFLTPVYAIFNSLDRESSGIIGSHESLIQTILLENATLRRYVRERLTKAVEKMDYFAHDSMDTGMILAILDDAICTGPAEWQVVRATYKVDHLQQTTGLYDQLVYSLIFWNGLGVCGSIGDEPIQGSTTRIRKILICLMLQSRNHFIHGLETLREEFLCAIAGLLVNIFLKWMLGARRCHFAREDEIRERDGDGNGRKEYGLRSFIPASVIDRDQYWHGVAEKYFALSSQMGAPTFFLL
jgi:hypothetical protein